MEFNMKLKATLLERGFTQREMAFAIGISESQISTAIRHGKTTRQLRRRVSEFLDVSESQIFGKG